MGTMSCVANSRSVWQSPEARTSIRTSRPIGGAMSSSSRSNPRPSALRTSAFIGLLLSLRGPCHHRGILKEWELMRPRHCFDQTDTGEVSMELRHLRYFVGVAEEQHFGRAAERLSIVQPALSRQIQDLERELGFSLFDRLPRGVKLNAAGKLFLEDARRILRELNEAKARAARVARGQSVTLRVGFTESASWQGVVPESFRRF